jgi:hypothetical protein
LTQLSKDANLATQLAQFLLLEVLLMVLLLFGHFLYFSDSGNHFGQKYTKKKKQPVVIVY